MGRRAIATQLVAITVGAHQVRAQPRDERPQGQGRSDIYGDPVGSPRIEEVQEGRGLLIDARDGGDQQTGPSAGESSLELAGLVGAHLRLGGAQPVGALHRATVQDGHERLRPQQ